MQTIHQRRELRQFNARELSEMAERQRRNEEIGDLCDRIVIWLVIAGAGVLVGLRAAGAL